MRRREVRRELLEHLLLPARQGARDARFVLGDELLLEHVDEVVAEAGDDLPRGRDEQRLDVRRRELLEPRYAERDARERAPHRRELRRLGELGHRLGHDDPERVLREHARPLHRRRDDELESDRPSVRARRSIA